MDNCIDSRIANIMRMLQNIQNSLLVYVNKPIGVNWFIPASKHKLNFVKGYLLLDSVGDSVEIAFRVYADQSVLINSNVDMTGCTLLLY